MPVHISKHVQGFERSLIDRAVGIIAGGETTNVKTIEDSITVSTANPRLLAKPAIRKKVFASDTMCSTKAYFGSSFSYPSPASCSIFSHHGQGIFQLCDITRAQADEGRVHIRSQSGVSFMILYGAKSGAFAHCMYTLFVEGSLCECSTEIGAQSFTRRGSIADSSLQSSALRMEGPTTAYGTNLVAAANPLFCRQTQNLLISQCSSRNHDRFPLKSSLHNSFSTGLSTLR